MKRIRRGLSGMLLVLATSWAGTAHAQGAAGAALARLSEAWRGLEEARQIPSAATTGWLLSVDGGLVRDPAVIDLVRGAEAGTTDLGALDPPLRQLLSNRRFRSSFLANAEEQAEMTADRNRWIDDVLCGRELNSELAGLNDTIDLAAQKAANNTLHPPKPPPTIQSGLLERPVMLDDNEWVFVGDGGLGGPAQWDVVDAIADDLAEHPVGAVFLGGDNVYYYGEPWLFHERIYRPWERLLKQKVPLFGIPGNHDAHMATAWEQMQYLGNGRRRFFKVSMAGGAVDVFNIDTTVLLRDQQGYRGLEEFRQQVASEQMAWLEKELATSTARIKVVEGHHPGYSSGVKARAPDREQIRELLNPVLKRHHVKVNLTGHDHQYERSTVDGIVHIVSGGGGMEVDAAKVFHDGTHTPDVLTFEHHYLRLRWNGQALEIRAVSPDGRVLDEVTVDP